MELSILRPIIKNATQSVAEQIAKFVNGDADVIDSNAEEIAIKDLDKVVCSYIDPFMLYSSLEGGEIRGTSLTIFEKKEAIYLASLLTSSKVDYLDERCYSALREASNVVSGTYANVLAKGIKETICSTQPLIVHKDDIGDIQEELTKAVGGGDSLYLLKAKFKIKNQNINIGLFMFFNHSLERNKKEV